MDNPISVTDLEYTSSTRGWKEIIVPHWERQIKLLEAKLEATTRKTTDLTQIKQDRGYLDGYVAASNVVFKIIAGLRLRNRLRDVK